MTTDESKILTTSKQRTFKLRSKFVKIVTDENHDAIANAFDIFFDSTPTRACHYLWNLTYSPDFFLDKLGLKGFLSPENTSLLINDLRFQYEICYPDFMYIYLPDDSCRLVYNTLATKSNPIVAHAVYMHVVDPVDIPRILYLLSSDLDKFYIVGLYSLGFNKYEAMYLTPYRMEIHDLLKAIYDYNNEVHKQNANRPFAELNKQLAEAGIVLSDETSPTSEASASAESGTIESAISQAEVHEEISSVAMTITAENVLKYKDVFEEYLNSLSALSDIGFNPKDVIENGEKICALLKALKAF